MDVMDGMDGMDGMDAMDIVVVWDVLNVMDVKDVFNVIHASDQRQNSCSTSTNSKTIFHDELACFPHPAFFTTSGRFPVPILGRITGPKLVPSVPYIGKPFYLWD